MPILIPEPHDEVCFREDGRRLDGRTVDEPREFKCKVGVIDNAQGSAYVEHGGNKIYASVYGPREVHPRHLARPDRGILRVNYRMATFSVHERKSPAPNRREIEISKVIREALEPVLFLEAYPDSQIEIFIEVIAADGGTRCASTTCASLALADAGIPMRSLVVGIAAGKAQGKVILDLNDKEDKVGQADMPAAVIMRDKKISLLQFDGEMTPEEIQLAFDYILKGAEYIYKKQIEALKEKYREIDREVAEEDKKIEEEQMGNDGKGVKEGPSEQAQGNDIQPAQMEENPIATAETATAEPADLGGETVESGPEESPSNNDGVENAPEDAQPQGTADNSNTSEETDNANAGNKPLNENAPAENEKGENNSQNSPTNEEKTEEI